MRKHYITLCARGNTEVTHVLKNGRLEVTFESAVNNGFNTVIFDDKCNIISNTGFNASDIEFFKTFLMINLNTMYAEARGEF